MCRRDNAVDILLDAVSPVTENSSKTLKNEFCSQMFFLETFDDG